MIANAARLDRFFELLLQPVDGDVFHPWLEQSKDDVSGAGPAQRLDRLRAHLNIDLPRLILVGEAPGWRGCRASGVAFTSEHLLLAGTIPRVGAVARRVTNQRLPLREPSATIVWEALEEFGVADGTILWNAFPYHPHDAGNPYTNRTPSDAERERAEPILAALLHAFPGATLAAVGKVAATSVSAIMSDEVPILRHPSFGGKTEFRTGLRAVLSRAGLLQPQPALFA